MVAVLVNISSRTVKWRALKQALIKAQQSLRQVGEFHWFFYTSWNFDCVPVAVLPFQPY